MNCKNSMPENGFWSSPEDFIKSMKIWGFLMAGRRGWKFYNDDYNPECCLAHACIGGTFWSFTNPTGVFSRRDTIIFSLILFYSFVIQN